VRQVTVRPWILGLGLAFAALGLHGQTAPTTRAIPLDIPADWEPVLCKGRLFLFSTEGRNQVLSPGDDAPQCDPVQFTPTLQPVCAQSGTVVLDAEGNLWQLGEGLPKTVQSGLSGAVGLWPSGQGVAVLFKDHLELPGGARAALPFEAAGGNALADGGSWIRGAKQAARVSDQGAILWTWSPRSGAPGPATLAKDVLVSGSSDGTLWALSAPDGKPRFGYRGGGALFGPPIVDGDRFVAATSDHVIRAVNLKNGQLAWQFRASGRPAYGPFRVPAGILFAEEGGRRLVLLSPKTGSAAWSWSLPSGSLIDAPAVENTRAALLAWGEASTPTLYLVDLPAIEPSGPVKKPAKKDKAAQPPLNAERP
jgi:hypothetical protein